MALELKDVVSAPNPEMLHRMLVLGLNRAWEGGSKLQRIRCSKAEYCRLWEQSDLPPDRRVHKDKGLCVPYAGGFCFVYCGPMPRGAPRVAGALEPGDGDE